MELAVATEDYDKDVAAQNIWNAFAQALPGADGIAFYAHPILTERHRRPPDLAILPEGYEPIIIRVIDATIEDLQETGDEAVFVPDGKTERPLVELDDYLIAIDAKFNRHRELRRRFHPVPVIALPNVAKTAFETRFGPLPEPFLAIWADLDVGDSLRQLPTALEGEHWRLAKAVFQTATPIKPDFVVEESSNKALLGDAIATLRKRVALLDQRQMRLAVSVPPGPQRIRGLAGTGKTVLLAMRAANVHLRNPQARILFTFHTRSLYQMIRDLVGRFYRDQVGTDPDWDMLQVRHAWGARDEPGVYSDWARRAGKQPLDFRAARIRDRASPLRACARHALAGPEGLEPLYDFIFVDEAQDLPAPFMQFLLRLTKPPYKIYFAQDAMQNLGEIDVPSPGDIFGTDAEGRPLVNLDHTYAGGMEADFVLDTAYRSDANTLMLAHGLGLGIHRKGGPVQMLMAPEEWRGLGYKVEAETFTPGQNVQICRGTGTSPTDIASWYSGEEDPISVHVADNPPGEPAWIAKEIGRLVTKERVRPEDILIVPLEARSIHAFTSVLRVKLAGLGIDCHQAGKLHASRFRVEGSVTVSSTFRAKGNESPVVFMAQMQELYSYADEKRVRNLVFTAISRSMGWVRLSGWGAACVQALREVTKIRQDLPCFKFTFPRGEDVYAVEAEISRRRKDVSKAKRAIAQLVELDDAAIASLSPAQLDELRRKLDRAGHESE